MKVYLKKRLNEETYDDIRILLSVRANKLGPEPVCDICGSTSPVVVYASSRMSTGEMRRCWRWCACSDCETLIESNDFTAMIAKIVSRINEMTLNAFSEKMIERAAKSALDEFKTYAIEVSVE